MSPLSPLADGVSRRGGADLQAAVADVGLALAGGGAEAAGLLEAGAGRRRAAEGPRRTGAVIAAALTLQASYFLGGSPKRIKRPLTGWRKRLEEDEPTNWAC